MEWILITKLGLLSTATLKTLEVATKEEFLACYATFFG